MSEPMIFVKRFWTEYKEDKVKPGTYREVDMVEYGPMGSAQYLMVTEAISRLSCVVPLEGRAQSNPAVQMAHSRWNAIKPKYEAWKSGQTTPLNGTPLAAWNGINQQQGEIFKLHGIHTVEDVSKLTDSHRQRIGLPGMMDLIDNAKRFLLSIDKASVTSALAERDAKIADLTAKMEELMTAVRGKTSDAAELPASVIAPVAKRPGWPKGKPRKPKVEENAVQV